MLDLISKLKVLADKVRHANEAFDQALPNHTLVDDALHYADNELLGRRIQIAIAELEGNFSDNYPSNLPLLKASYQLVVAKILTDKYYLNSNAGLHYTLAVIEKDFEECEREISEYLSEIEALR